MEVGKKIPITVPPPVEHFKIQVRIASCIPKHVYHICFDSMHNFIRFSIMQRGPTYGQIFLHKHVFRVL